MSYYTLRRITYSNFKHIPSGATAEFDISPNDSQHSVTILDGPNGYGKTTLFQAIELVLTGEIRDFKKDLRSKGIDDYSVLANNPDFPMELAVDFQASDGIWLHILRKWDFKSSGQVADLTLNGLAVSQNELEKTLNFNGHIFDLGLYLSQKESLSFLQNKYKERGSQLASILDTSSIQEKISFIESVKQSLQNKQNKVLDSFDTNYRKLVARRNDLGVQLTKSSKETVCPLYERLFFDMQYPFDEETFDINIPYTARTDALVQLKEFLENYETYRVTCDNSALDKLLQVDKKIYFALFNNRFIEILDNNAILLNDLHFAQHALENLQAHHYPINCNTYAHFGVSMEDIDMLNSLSMELNVLSKQLGTKESAIQEIMDSREQFISVYKKNQKLSNTKPNTCPLCGTKLDNLLNAIKQAESELHNTCSNLQESIKTVKTKQQVIGDKIIGIFEHFINENKTLLEIETTLSNIRMLDSSPLKKMLASVELTDFTCNDEYPSTAAFEVAYNNIITELQARKRPVTLLLSEQQLATYARIHKQYYNNKKPCHTAAQIQRKIEYIACLYSQKVTLEYQALSDQIKKIEFDSHWIKSQYDEKIKTISVILEKYKNAQTEYNKLIQRALCLPIYIYSGRIIQNYPLGLGIYAEIDAKKILLKPEWKGDDVYNVLSAGQLNGLALAILLAVHAVYTKDIKFDVVMIDDPLQTIDEVSSISLIDLLAEQSNFGQLLLSTHEPYKADLFQYKFHQTGFHINRINMQQRYLQLQNQ